MVSSKYAALGLAQLHLFPIAWAVGCHNCLGYDKYGVVSTCRTACADPNFGFTAQDQVQDCQTNCNKFVNIQNCCNTASCSSDPRTCAHPSRLSSREARPMDKYLSELENIKRDASLIDFSRLISRDPPYDSIVSTEDLRFLFPSALSHWQLEETASTRLHRRSPADICCKVAKGMVIGAQTLIPAAFQGSKDDLYASLIILATGLAAAEVCGKYFAMICNPLPSAIAPA